MKPTRKISRRSFLATVSGAAVSGGALLAVHGPARAGQATDSDPSDPIGHGRGGTGSGVTDSDPGDPVGNGRGGTRSGVTDGDPSDPYGNGRGGSGAGTQGRSGCSDTDPTDPGGNGRNCGGRAGDVGGGGGGAYQTGRHERRYEVCWVDDPSRTNDECNMQTYSEWQTTWSDGRVEYDVAEAHARQAEMTARGYTARGHRMLVNDWVGQ
ncbi:MAG TPA: hypothetical protein VGX37_04530 [Allosphingosinicella sp.]|nr:hypothetical protein [Allosphingosinicella sp.]